MPVIIGSASTVWPPTLAVVRVPAHGTGTPLGDMSHQTPCHGGRPGSSQASPVTAPGCWSNRYSGGPAEVTCQPTPWRKTRPSRARLTPGPATGLPLVVMAGHSAFLSFDGPVQVIGPIGVLVTPVVQPKLWP